MLQSLNYDLSFLINNTTEPELKTLWNSLNPKFFYGIDTFETFSTHIKKIDSKNNTYYRHNIEGCPDLANSIFVTPTSPDPWIPYEVFCEKNVGRFTHKDVLKFADRVCNAAS